MKNFNIKSLASAGVMALAMTAAAGLAGCHDNYDEPPVKELVATWQPNISIVDLKTEFWDAATNYITEIPAREDGSHYIIHGWVISSDASGNIYKSLVVRDETAALALSINQSNLYVDYPLGQEIVIDVTGMYIGKYNGLQQLGYPEWYESGSAWEATFMPYRFFTEHVQLNGKPDLSKTEPITLNYSEISSATDEQKIKWQSQFVRIDNCSFQDAGQATFTDGHKVTSNRTLLIDGGESMIVRTSGYSNFWNRELPTGTGSVEAILSFYGSSGWQLLLNNYQGCIGFEGMEPEEGDAGSTIDNPLTVEAAIAIEKAGGFKNGWVTGYIVGAVAPGVSAVTSDADIDWGADAALPTTLVIGQTADTRSIDQAIVIELPRESRLREYGNLVDNPANLGRVITVKGSLNKVLSTWGITGNEGHANEFKIEGVDVPAEETPDTPSGGLAGIGDGTAASPYNVARALDIINKGQMTDSEVYVSGIIDKIKEVDTGSYGNASYYIKDNGSSTNFYIYHGYYLDGARFTSADQIKVGDNVTVCGKLVLYTSQYGSTPEMAQGNKITEINGQSGTVTPDPEPEPEPVDPGVAPAGDGTEASPYNVARVLELGQTGAKAWVEGYIVGFTSGSMANATFSAAGASASNLLLADSPDVNSAIFCIPVELKSKTEARTQLNLADNPGNIGKKVALEGTITAYFSVTGLKSVSAFSFK